MNSEDKKRWTKSIFVALIIFSLISFYLYVRRGYYNPYIINKVFGSTAAVLAGITLLTGPLSRYIPFFTKLMTIRRQLGLTAFFLALLHVCTSILFLQSKFPLSWYIQEWLPITFGTLAVGIWAYMTYISRNSKIVELTSAVWKKRLSISGLLAFLFIFLHLTVMKYQGWIRWFNGEVKKTPELANPTYPPASLFVLAFIAIVILYRIVVFLKKK